MITSLLWRNAETFQSYSWSFILKRLPGLLPFHYLSFLWRWFETWNISCSCHICLYLSWYEIWAVIVWQPVLGDVMTWERMLLDHFPENIYSLNVKSHEPFNEGLASCLWGKRTLWVMVKLRASFLHPDFSIHFLTDHRPCLPVPVPRHCSPHYLRSNDKSFQPISVLLLSVHPSVIPSTLRRWTIEGIEVIAIHRILWYVITYPCPCYLLLASKFLYVVAQWLPFGPHTGQNGHATLRSSRVFIASPLP